MWVHESFANYAEGIYTECQDGKQAGAEYIIGSRRNIKNDAPIVGAYGVNDEGSGDKYYKGGSMLHMLRQLVDDDEKWRGILRGLNSTFWHQTVTGAQIEAYISAQARHGLQQDLPAVPDDDATFRFSNTRSTAGDSQYRWTNVVPGLCDAGARSRSAMGRSA